MGFLNYSLAIGLFFLAAGLWIRAGGGARGAPGRGPDPIVAALCDHRHCFDVDSSGTAAASDFILRAGPRPLRSFEDYLNDRSLPASGERPGFSLGNYRWPLFGFVVACLSFLYPLASADRSRSVANLHSTALHLDGVISSIALAGISPFDTRSTNLLIDLYRLGLYAILFGCLALAARGWARRWRARALGPGDTLLVGAIAVLIAIPILPQEMNGSDYFAQRLMIFPWLAAIAAASSYPSPRRLARIAPVFAVVMAALTLMPAEIFIRPVARQLASLEAQPLQEDTGGLAILDPAMLKAVRLEHQLGFNPYVWSAALPFHPCRRRYVEQSLDGSDDHADQAAEGGHLLIDEMSSTAQAARIINGNIDLPEMPPALRSPLLASADVIVFVGVPGGRQAGTGAARGRRPSRSLCVHGPCLVSGVF